MIRTVFFLKNPFSIWLKWIVKTLIVYFKNSGKKIKIGYLSHINLSQLGYRSTIYEHCQITNSTIGDFSYTAPRTKVSNALIGKFCSIGPDVKIGLGIHPTSNFVSTHPIFYSTLKQSQISWADKDYVIEHKRIKIGNDVWIGANAIVLDGVKISNGAIIAAGAIVTKDIPPYAVVGGIPAKILHYRFSEKVISELLHIKWWDLPYDKISKNYKDYHDVNTFCQHNSIK